MSDAPSVPFTSGLDTLMRGSVSLTVTPSAVAAGGGVANGCATKPGVGEAAATVVAGDVVAVARGLRSHPASTVIAAAALPTPMGTPPGGARRGAGAPP